MFSSHHSLSRRSLHILSACSRKPHHLNAITPSLISQPLMGPQHGFGPNPTPAVRHFHINSHHLEANKENKNQPSDAEKNNPNTNNNNTSPFPKFQANTQDPLHRRQQQQKRFRYQFTGMILAFTVLYSVLYFTDLTEYFRRKALRKQEENENQPGAGGSTKKAVGKPKVGGAFTLVESATGLPITDSKFRGKYLLIYFGFCNCPDICPEEMEKVTKSVNYLEQHHPNVAEKLQLVFVSVDPHRDSLEAIEEYLKDFHPKYIGLTGTPQQVKEACRKYRVFYSAPEDASRDGDYAVDHSIYTYLMDEYGELVEYFSQDSTQEEVTEGIVKCIRDGRSRFAV